MLRCAYEQQISNYGKKAKFELRGIGDMAEAGEKHRHMERILESEGCIV